MSSVMSVQLRNSRYNLNPNAEEFIPLRNEASISQREVLIRDINENRLECAICCDKVKAADPVWNCEVCFQSFHLDCMKKWKINQQRSGRIFKCPTCNNQSVNTSMKSLCFCGKVENPLVNWNHLPHSCDKQCLKELVCGHHCNFSCHPGQHMICECSRQEDVFEYWLCNKRICNLHFCLEENHHQGDCRKCTNLFCNDDLKNFLKFVWDVLLIFFNILLIILRLIEDIIIFFQKNHQRNIQNYNDYGRPRQNRSNRRRRRRNVLF